MDVELSTAAMGRLHAWFGLDLLGCYCLGCLRVGRRRAFSPLRSIVSFAWAASWSAREWLLALGSSGGVELITMHAEFFGLFLGKKIMFGP